VAMVVLSLIVVLAASMIGSIQNIWKRTSARAEQFRAARQGLETVSARLTQATLNPYWVVTSTNGVPTRYERQSDLRFLALSGTAALVTSFAQPGSALFFQAPTGYSSSNATRLNAALNTWGYFVEYGPDTPYRPPFLATTNVPVNYRFRLIEFTDPSDTLQIFTYTSGSATYTGHDWYSSPLGVAANRRVLAENIVALVALPRLSSVEDSTGTALAPYYAYDSTSRSDPNSDPKLNPRHQLPPIVDLAVVALDENSARRITWGITPPDFGASTSALFQQAVNMDADLETLRDNIEKKFKIPARVFRTSVAIPAARWSTEQTN